MIQAERLLLSAALEDPANQRFVLLSDSCVPLYNFSYVYNYIMVSPKSFVDSFLDVKEGRYNPKMSPKIPREKWRKGSQVISLIFDFVILNLIVVHSNHTGPLLLAFFLSRVVFFYLLHKLDRTY